jgi:lipoate-protein ligase A
MISSASKKVKEGKLVKVEVEHDEVIKKIKITGDFFLLPEDALQTIEKSMLGMEKETGIETIISKIRSVAEIYNVQMIGISPESLAQVIREALN